MFRLKICAIFLTGIFINQSIAQLTVVKQTTTQGKVVSVKGNTLQLQTEQGNQSVLFAKPGERAVPLPKGGVNLRHQTEIKVTGQLPISALQPGAWVEFTAKLSRPGKSEGEVTQFKLLGAANPSAKIVASRTAENSRDFVPCQVTARVTSIRKLSISLALEKQEFAPQGRIRVRASEEATVSISENSLDRVRAGDLVETMNVIELNTGDQLARSVQIKLAESGNQSLASKNKNGKANDPFAKENYLQLSDQPGKPRDLRSRYFLLHTDLSDRSAKRLLDKLEFMLGMMSRYYGKRPSGIIECFVVRDLSQWKDVPLEPAGVAKIRAGAGVTISRSIGNQRRSIVYSCADHGVVQHESVHAYCSQTFGSTGPTWYSEGMAEMGQYWKKDNLAVDISPPVIRYLTRSEPKKLLDIVAQGQITGDSWQAYAWRWALCHLLANNPNYSPRFKALGLNMMSGGKASFESVYGDVAKEISFEYDFFVKHFGNGYRADLCSWDWNTKPIPISGNRRIQCKVDAAKGWQASRLKLNQGRKYEYVATGQWKTSPSSAAVDANGDQAGNGKLVAVVFKDYQLSQVIELGQKGFFTAESDGHLFLRCRDNFTQLADNDGTLTVHFRRAKKE